MATATLSQEWTGRSGRIYVPVPKARVRHGELATVRKVTEVGGDQAYALKVWSEGSSDLALEVLQTEARVLSDLMSREGDLPCPRLIDLIGEPVVSGLVMEWCPGDLERWWRERLTEADAFGRLCATMAEVARRVSDYHVFFAQRGGIDLAHGDLKPGNILLSAQGAWLISDFGAAQINPPSDSPWATSDIVLGTENFLAPEMLFHARKPHAAAVDTWALGAVLFAMLRLQRMVLDGEAIPRNGTASPRFRTARVEQVLEIYRREPTAFADARLDAGAFPDPLRMPEADRRAVRDAVRGVFGSDGEDREHALSEAVLDVLDRALSIDPAHRYTSARDLAAAFEDLTRRYITLSAESEEAPTLIAPRPGAAEGRAERLEEQVASLRLALRESEQKAAQARKQPVTTSPPGTSRLVVPLLVALLVLHGLTLLAVLSLLGLVAAG